MVKKILLLLLIVPFLLLILAPKKELYFFLEKRLAAQDIILSNETVTENIVGITLEHPVFYYKGIKVATARSIRLWSWLVYGRGSIEGLSFDPSLKRFVPGTITKATLTHSILKPTAITVAIEDAALGGDGSIDLSGRTVQMLFPHLPPSSPVTQYLKHNKEGWVYEKRF